MSVKYNVVERGKPSDSNAPTKFYPSIASSGRLTLRQLSTRIAQISTVSSADVMAVLEAFLTVVPDELANGHIVELGDFGNFWLKSTSTGVSAAEEVSGKQIKTLLPRFNPGKEFKKVLTTVEFEKA